MNWAIWFSGLNFAMFMVNLFAGNIFVALINLLASSLCYLVANESC